MTCYKAKFNFAFLWVLLRFRSLASFLIIFLLISLFLWYNTVYNFLYSYGVMVWWWLIKSRNPLLTFDHAVVYDCVYYMFLLIYKRQEFFLPKEQGTWYLQLVIPKMKTGRLFETSVLIYWTAQRHIQKSEILKGELNYCFVTDLWLRMSLSVYMCQTFCMFLERQRGHGKVLLSYSWVNYNSIHFET